MCTSRCVCIVQSKFPVVWSVLSSLSSGFLLFFRMYFHLSIVFSYIRWSFRSYWTHQEKERRKEKFDRKEPPRNFNWNTLALVQDVELHRSFPIFRVELYYIPPPLSLIIPSPFTHTHIVSVYFVHLSHNNIYSLEALRQTAAAASKSFRIIAIHAGERKISNLGASSLSDTGA